ncbi:transposase [Pontiella sulfatireligans]|uniref:transposase n=1 Tax=Pontiella sulfatireligans TaxID=2750658 RepID=UPI00319E0519
MNGTHHGVDPKYLQTYLDEFTFRFNRRKTPMAAFQTLLGIATQKAPQTLTDLKNP